MAHEISNVNGRNEAFYALQPAWHGLGTVLDHAPTSELAMEAAHLNWDVELQDLTTVGGIKIPDHFATVRTDTREVLGVVGKRYSIVQNREAFAFLDSLMQDGLIRYESAGALRGGKLVWLLARMPSVDTIAEGDDCLRYILFSTGHDGNSLVHGIPTSTRVVCANTLRVALASDFDFSFRHTGNVQEKMNVARQYLSQFDAKFTLFRDEARKLATAKYTPDQAREYVAKLFPEVKEDGRGKTIRENKVSQVRANFRNPRNSMPSIKGTWWQLVNSVTEAVDHDANKSTAKPHLKENRMLSLTDGTGADFKAQAFKLAIQMAM